MHGGLRAFKSKGKALNLHGLVVPGGGRYLLTRSSVHFSILRRESANPKTLLVEVDVQMAAEAEAYAHTKAAKKAAKKAKKAAKKVAPKTKLALPAALPPPPVAAPAAVAAPTSEPEPEPEPMVDPAICPGETKAGNPCKRKPRAGSRFCSDSHERQFEG